MTRGLCFTVDVDRDVNECVPGRAEAVSLNSDNGRRFTSSEEGTDILLDMLDEIGIKATFFVEARLMENTDICFGSNEVAMHGLDHEDMTGEISGVHLSDDSLEYIIRTSADIIKDHTGSMPKGFRAPYMRTDQRISDMVRASGVDYDSSTYADLNRSMHPHMTDNGLTGIPVPVAADSEGKRMSAYLWPMHEGIRGPDGYIRMANVVKEGTFVMATHSWHMIESRSDGPMDKARRQRNMDDVRRILTSLLDNGFEAVRMSDLLG